MLRYLISYVLILNLALSCQKKDIVIKVRDEPDVHLLVKEDEEMNQAVANAKKTLFRFKNAITAKNPHFYNFALKERFNTAGGGGEHIWISEIDYYNGKFYGIVDGQPVSTTDVNFGDTIEVKNDDITDWMYIDNDVVKGAFTTRVLRKRMTREEREAMDHNSGVRFENE